MEAADSPSSFRNELREIESLAKAELRKFLEQLIIERRSRYISVGPDVNLEHVVIQLFRASESLEFHSKFREVVFDLLYAWSAALRYLALSRLLVLVAATGIVECRKDLVIFAQRQQIRGIVFDGEEMHLRLLRVIVSLGVTPSMKPLFVRDLSEPLYAPICYRAFWELDLRNGCRYLPEVVRVGVKNTDAFSFGFVFSSMLDAVGRKQFLSKLKRIPKELTDSELAFLILAMRCADFLLVYSKAGHGTEVVDLTEMVNSVDKLRRYTFWRENKTNLATLQEYIRERIELDQRQPKMIP